MSNVPPLPSEVWTLIVEDYVSQLTDRLSLALTSRLLRDITQPMVYKCLSFIRFNIRKPGESVAASYSERDDVVASSTNITDRIEFLRSRSDVRGCVREVVIYGWSARPISPHAGEKVEIRRATTDAYAAIGSILPMLPRLEKLKIIGSPITLNMRSFLPQLPHLESLDIRDIIGEIQESNRAEQESQWVISRGFHSLKELTFLCRERFDVGTFYLRQLLASLAPERLTRLCVYDWCLPHISMARINLHSLLQVEIGLRLDGRSTDTRPLYRLLSRSQDIREIRVRPTLSLNSPPPSESVLPRLECVSGSIDILFALVPGRPVQRIELFAVEFPTLLGFIPLQKSTVDITHLTLYIKSLSADDIRHCGHVLTKLQHFNVQLRSQPSRQDCMMLFHAVVETLPHWSELESCYADAKGLSLDDDGTASQKNCPIAKRENANDRGHSSLRELQLFSHLKWTWTCRGWECANMM